MPLHRSSLPWGKLSINQPFSKVSTNSYFIKIPRSQLLFDCLHRRHLDTEKPSSNAVLCNFSLYHYDMDWRSHLAKCLGRPRMAMGIRNFHHHRSGRGLTTMHFVLLEPPEGQEDGPAAIQSRSPHPAVSQKLSYRGRHAWNSPSCWWYGTVPSSIQPLVLPKGPMAF